MRKITVTPAKSMLVGELPRGCQLCITGEKLVVFVSGLCPRDCFYCTLSDKRKNSRESWANEQSVKSDEDMISEAKLCAAKGAGITGGEPLLKENIAKTLHYITILKKNFGKAFHIHLYTSGIGMSEPVLQQLEDAGLDEIRFHLEVKPKDESEENHLEVKPKDEGEANHLDVENAENWKVLMPALKHKFDVGVEIPCIPGTLRKLEAMADWLESNGVKFLNLNEFELSELQYDEMDRRGFIIADGAMRQVKGSRELAQKLLAYAAKNCKNLSVHFCPSMLKDVYQYTNRIRRRAESVKNPTDIVTKEGLLKKGVIFAEIGELDFLRRNELFWRKELNRTETTVENARRAAKRGFSAAIVLELPTADGFDIESEPL